jgi:hypothetical protein
VRTPPEAPARDRVAIRSAEGRGPGEWALAVEVPFIFNTRARSEDGLGARPEAAKPPALGVEGVGRRGGGLRQQAVWAASGVGDTSGVTSLPLERFDREMHDLRQCPMCDNSLYCAIWDNLYSPKTLVGYLLVGPQPSPYSVRRSAGSARRPQLGFLQELATRPVTGAGVLVPVTRPSGTYVCLLSVSPLPKALRAELTAAVVVY